MTQIDETNPANSAEDAIQRFSTKGAAEKYQSALVGSKKDAREKSSIHSALSGIPHGSHILDFPCGTGRITSFLVEQGYRVTAADSSHHMTLLAKKASEERTVNPEPLAVTDILKTAFRDDSFDAVVCNRLFHHFFEPEIRKQALRELARICSGPIVISYYSTHCIDALTFKVKNFIRRRSPTDRVPISPAKFLNEINHCGLSMVRQISSRPLVSMQSYVVLSRN